LPKSILQYTRGNCEPEKQFLTNGGEFFNEGYDLNCGVLLLDGTAHSGSAAPKQHYLLMNIQAFVILQSWGKALANLRPTEAVFKSIDPVNPD
jgi:hypothetical protein